MLKAAQHKLQQELPLDTSKKHYNDRSRCCVACLDPGLMASQQAKCLETLSVKLEFWLVDITVTFSCNVYATNVCCRLYFLSWMWTTRFNLSVQNH